MLKTGPEVAKELGLESHRTLDQWRYLGKGPKYVRVGRHVRYRDEDVQAWLEAHTITPAISA